MTLENIIKLQKEYILTDVTKDVHYRKESLERLLESINDNEPALYTALKKDLGKSKHESYITEVAMVKEEINYAIDNLERWSRPKRVLSPFYLMTSKSMVYTEPFGVVLIISPWNYPVNLTLSPLIGAIAAGNTVIVKGSKKSEHTTAALAALINSTFDKRYVYAIDEPLSYTEIMSHEYDYIFFTGSERVGKSVMRSAAANLTPVTLELGGKSPCIIGPEADLDNAAKQIMYGKILNAGQTCIAPDYALVPKNLKDDFIIKARERSAEMVRDPFNNDNYPKIINLHHFMRLSKYIADDPYILGGRRDDKQMKIEPAILPNATFDSEIMKEEIFGPILPVIEYDDLEEALDTIKRRPKPLACYIFSQNKDFIDNTIDTLSFGCCSVNDCMTQLSNPRLPFGGVGASGMGKYHGKAGFDTFSNTKTALITKRGIHNRYKYPPFSDEGFDHLRKFLK